MSQENVEIVRDICAAFNDHRLEVFAELFDPGWVWYPNPEDPEREPRHGYEEAFRLAACLGAPRALGWAVALSCA
jgi:hypothetical protein